LFVVTGKVFVEHQLNGGGVVTASADVPADRWVTVTSTASFVTLLNRTVTSLYLNGRRLGSASQIGGLSPNGGAQVVIGKATATPNGASFPGLVDDVWVEAGTSAIQDLDESWFLCDKQHASALVAESFEQCPTGANGASVVRRENGTPAVCPPPQTPPGALCQ
jgi:hypothetical protein